MRRRFSERIHAVMEEVLHALLNPSITEEEYQDEYARYRDQWR